MRSWSCEETIAASDIGDTDSDSEERKKPMELIASRTPEQRIHDDFALTEQTHKEDNDRSDLTASSATLVETSVVRRSLPDSGIGMEVTTSPTDSPPSSSSVFPHKNARNFFFFISTERGKIAQELFCPLHMHTPKRKNEQSGLARARAVSAPIGSQVDCQSSMRVSALSVSHVNHAHPPSAPLFLHARLACASTDQDHVCLGLISESDPFLFFFRNRAMFLNTWYKSCNPKLRTQGPLSLTWRADSTRRPHFFIMIFFFFFRILHSNVVNHCPSFTDFSAEHSNKHIVEELKTLLAE